MTDRPGWRARASAWLLRWTNGRVVFLSGLAMLAVMLFFLPRAAGGSTPGEAEVTTPDVAFFYAPSHLYRFAEAEGEAGRALYIRNRLTLDVLFPLTYGVFFASAIAVGMRRAFPRQPGLAQLGWVGLGGMAADLVENAVLSTIMLIYPQRLPGLAWFAAGASAVKWILVAAGMALALFALIAWATVAWRRRSS